MLEVRGTHPSDRTVTGGRHDRRRIGHRQGRSPPGCCTRTARAAAGPFVSVNCGAIPGQSGRGRAVRVRARSLHRGGTPASGLFRACLAEEHCSSTKSPKCRSTFRRSCCASSRADAWFASAETEEIAIDVRIVTATNRSTGRGRPRSPPARGPVLPARRDRRPPAAAAAPRRRHRAARGGLPRAAQSGVRHGETVRSGFAGRARAHAWPGNVRELKNCVERSYVLSDDVVRLDVQPAPDVSDAGLRR